MSFRRWRRIEVFSSLPKPAWRRVVNSWFSSSPTLAFRASAVISRNSFALAIRIDLHDLALQGQLLRGHAQGLDGQRAVDTAHFEKDTAGEGHGDPAFHGT